MPSHPQILRVPGVFAASPISSTDGAQMHASLNDYVVSEVLEADPALAPTHDDRVALASKLTSVATQYTQFLQNMAPCALASPNDSALQPKATAQETASNLANCLPPDLEAFWSTTSPLPPTAALTALYGLLPLRHASVLYKSNEDANEDIDSSAPTQQTTPSFQFLWTLCRTGWTVNKEQQNVSFWEAYAMTAMAAHNAAGRVTYGGSTGPSQGTSSSASSFSLAQQLRRATAVLDGMAPTLSPAATLLEWPESFLWNLLMSLLSALALIHNAGLHCSGQLTAANVLCLSCASSLPRLLEHTWHDVLAATTEQERKTGGNSDDATLFRRFYAVASRSVLLPQATLTSATPCHNAFFVVQPSVELLSGRPARGTTDAAQAVEDARDRIGSAAQETANETPEQQARFQAADLASVGRLLTTIVDLRAQWSREGGQGSLSTSPRYTAPATAVVHPSSELVFLVRRLCECAAAAESDTTWATAQRSCPTALQLLQLQALRLRTEAWHYRRLAAEAFDRLAQVQQIPQAVNAVVQSNLESATKRRVAQESNAHAEAEQKLRAREAAVTEREAKLDLILQVYELTHEHLDAVPLPKPQTPPSQTSGNARGMTSPGEDTTERSPPPREDSLEALLGAPAYRQAATTTPPPPQADASPVVEVRRAPNTNVSHQQPQRQAATAVAAATDTSRDALLDLSPLPRVPDVDDADATLLSARATPVHPYASDDQSRRQQAPHPQPWHEPFTHRAMDVGGPAAPPSAVGAEDRNATEPSPRTTFRPEAEARRTSSATAPLSANAQVSGHHVPRDASQPMPWDPSHQPPQPQQQQQHLLDGRRQLQRAEGPRHNSGNAGAPQPVTLVEVVLDDDSDTDDFAPTAAPPTMSGPASAPHVWHHRGAPPTEQRAWPARPSDSPLVRSPHPQPARSPSPLETAAPFFVRNSSPAYITAATRAAQDVRTPVRAPTLPNMGVADGYTSGTGPGVVAAGGAAGGGGSHSKYSSVAQLRTPPSARRLNTGTRVTSASPSASPHSPESFRSSTKPYATAAALASAHTAEMVERGAGQPRSARRRSASRGSSGSGNPRHRPHSASADVGLGGSPAGVTPRSGGAGVGVAPGTVSSDGGSVNENGEWARQQLTELQNMQTALRAQQPATPRSRAFTSAASPATAGEVRTPELRRARSPAAPSLSPSPSPPLRAEQQVPTSGAAGMFTPPSPSLQQQQHLTTPPRHAAVDGRSPLQSSSSRRTPHAADQAEGQVFHAHHHRHGDAEREDEPPVQVQGTAWSSASSSAAVHVMRTPLSSRQRQEVAWSAPAATSSAATRPTAVLLGGTTPPAKSTGRTAPSTAGVRGVGVLGSERGHFDTHGTAAATSTTAAALGAALRTPPRQTVRATSSVDPLEYRHLTNHMYVVGAAPPPPPAPAPSVHGSAVKNDTAASASTSFTQSARRPVTSAKESTAAPLRSSSRVAKPAAEVEVLPLRASSSGVSGSARGHHRGGPATKIASSTAPLKRSGEDGGPPLSLSPAHNHASPLAVGAAVKGTAQPRGSASSTSAMELLRRLRAGSAASV